MLYKKGDPTDPANYRPIGLALTVYKLWTALVTEVLADFAEAHGVLCDSQEGFRRRRSTQRQLGNLLNALEDAHHTRRDVYLLYIDFSNAFDTLDHDKLLQLMWDQGFPSQLRAHTGHTVSRQPTQRQAQAAPAHLPQLTAGPQPAHRAAARPATGCASPRHASPRPAPHRCRAQWWRA